MSDLEFYETMTLADDPFDPEEQEPEYRNLVEDCEHETVIQTSEGGEYWLKCLDCGLEF